LSDAVPVVLVLSGSGLTVARAVAQSVGGSVHGARKRVGADRADLLFDDLGDHLRALYRDGRPIVAVMAVGALVRLLAPVLSDKRAEPPVIAVADDGSAVVPLLGGHRGANELARKAAEALGVKAAITTAGDVRFGVALDAPPDGYVLGNRADAASFMADLVAGYSVALDGEASWLTGSGLPFAADADRCITITDKADTGAADRLVYHPRWLALGIGCERGCGPDEALSLARSALAEAGLAEGAVGLVVSLDLKADEGAVHVVADYFGVPARFFDAETLEAETPRLANPSEIVFAEVGCHGVAEGAALAAAGSDGMLAVEKRKSARATCAVARAPNPFTKDHMPGRARGHLAVVGIGPGSDEWRSPEVSAMMRGATDLVGYSLYLDLLGPLADGKARHDFDLGREEDRVRHAMELAGQGRAVALVCSGDAGIYAMATLVFELIDRGGLSDGATRIGIDVAPGISALQGAAARAGAPLGHDFCTISLSDLLTPWQDIQRRVRAAGEGDFVIAFYNPVSKKRRTQLAWARDELLTHRPADTPVILATNLGRPGETVRMVPLGEMQVDDVDMLTVVIVGSSDTRTVATGDGRHWAYTPRGYAGKHGTQISGGSGS
jgi:cobalt-precorrin 5A hydrolase/precorrin-3B C17-methyltransferase